MERSLSAAQRTHLSLRAVSLGARVTGEQVERSSAAQRTHLSLRAVSWVRASQENRWRGA